jgi:hypothetical protein
MFPCGYNTYDKTAFLFVKIRKKVVFRGAHKIYYAKIVGHVTLFYIKNS